MVNCLTSASVVAASIAQSSTFHLIQLLGPAPATALLGSVLDSVGRVELRLQLLDVDVFSRVAKLAGEVSAPKMLDR